MGDIDVSSVFGKILALAQKLISLLSQGGSVQDLISTILGYFNSNDDGES